MIINQKLPPFLDELGRRYQVSWKVIQPESARGFSQSAM
jgi:hypothetical protein